MSIDAYQYWRACLENGGKAPEDATFLPTYHGIGTHEEPQPGLYRTKGWCKNPRIP